MHRTPNRNLLMTVVLLVLLAFGLAPNAVLAAVNENFNAFALNTAAEALVIPGIASMASTPANAAVVQNFAIGAPFAGNAIFSIGITAPNTGMAGPMTISFTQPQSSYSMSRGTNFVGGNFTVQGLRGGVVVFTNNTPVPTTLAVGTATGSGAIFDQLTISSTTRDWAIDNLVTTNAPAGVTIIEPLGPPDVNEAGATTSSYDIALDSPPTASVQINLLPDANCIVSVPSITFAIGATAPQTVTVAAVDDAIAETEPHTCFITQTITTTDPVYTAITPPTESVTVHDNDTAHVTITPTTVNVSEAGLTEDYTVVLDTEPIDTVTINVSGDAQCNVNGGTGVVLTFNPASALLWSDPQTITVSALDDPTAEGAHTCTISHVANSASDPNYVPALVIDPVTGNITDNDVAGVTISALTPVNLDETGPTTADYDISLDTAPTLGVTINIAVDPSTAGQCSLSTGVLTFPGGTQGPQTITVTAADDLLIEAPTHFCLINHTAVSPGEPSYDGIAVASLNAPILDNDVAALTLVPDNGPNVSVLEATPLTADTYSLSLAAVPQANVTISIVPDAQCTVGTPSVTIVAPSTGPVTVSVFAVDDAIFESPVHPCVITHTVTASGPDYTGVTANLNVNVSDNDSPPAPVYSSVPAPASTINLNTTQGTNVTTTIDVSNLGSAAMNVSSVLLTGSPALTLTTPSSFGVPVGVGTQPITIQCDATTAGSFSTTVNVTHDGTAPPASPVTYTVNCNVTAPVYSSAPAPASTINLNTVQGTNVSTTINVSNTGTAPLNVSSVLLTGSPALTLTTPTSFIVPVGVGTQPVTVQCDATTVGAFSTTVDVTHDGTPPPGSPATYTINCNVTPTPVPVYGSSPAPASTITLNTTQGTNVTTTINVSNTGTAPLNISSVLLTGSAALTLTTPTSFTVPVGVGTQPVTIQCDATTVGAFSTTVDVTHDGTPPPVSPATYTINCNVTAAPAPIYSSAPAPASTITLNTTQGTNVTTTIDVSNTGTAPLNISSVLLTGSAALTLTTPTNFTVPVGVGTQPVTVQCDATTVGAFSTTVDVTHDGTPPPASPATYTVNCNVTAVLAPIYSSSPAAGSTITLNTPQGTNVTTTIDVSNTGTASLNISSVLLSGSPALTLTTPTSFSVPAAGGPSPITIQCDATTAGSFSTNVSVAHNATGTPAAYTINCNVTATPAPIYSSSPAVGSSITLNTPQGTNISTTINVSNTGTAPLNISSVLLTGSAALTLTTPTSFSVPVGVTTQPITVQCNAAAAGSFSTNVSVAHDAAGTPATYSINCTVTPPGTPRYSSAPAPGTIIAPTVINMSTAINVAGTTTIRVSEVGTADLNVGPITLSAGVPQLTLTSATNFTIVNGGLSVDIAVQCLNAAVGVFTTTLTVPHSGTAGATSPAVYTINCTVTATSGPVYSSQPSPGSTVTITSATTGQAASGTIRVSNTGIGTLDLTQFTFTANPGNHLSVILPSNQHLTANQSSDIIIQCDANFTGTVQGTFSVTHNGTGSAPIPATYPIDCTVGTGVNGPGYGSFPNPGSLVDVGTVLVGSQISSNIVVVETGNATLTVAPLAVGMISGTNAAEFSIISGAPPFNIVDGGASQTVTILCVPQAVGLRLATLTFFTNDPARSVVSYLLACVGSNVAVTTPTPIGFVPTAIPPTATIIIPATGQVTEVKGLAVRTGPYLGATLINVARPGTTYSILALNKDEGPYTWYLIQFSKRVVGWVSGRYLIVTGTISAVPYGGSIFDQIDNPPDVGVRLTTNAIIDMRRRPSPRAARVGTIPLGTEVIVLGRTVQERQTFWIQVSYNGIVGWVPALPVTMRGPVENIPVR